MKKYILSLCVGLVIILPTISLAQGWVARYNGPGDSLDRAHAITLDNSANIYVTGCSGGSGTSLDYATVKYDSSGVEQWVSRYNGPDNGTDYAHAIALDNAGNVYVTGYSWGSGAGPDYATVKYDSSGVEQWVERYNGPDNSGDKAFAIALDNSGNVYVTGWSWGIGTSGDYATVKYDSSGVEQWVARYNGPVNWGQDRAYAIVLDNSGNIYVTGYSGGSGTYHDYATIKYDSSGVEQWVARYNGPDNGYDIAYAIALDNSGNIYVTGESHGSYIECDYATVKYDSSGVEQWVARYNGPANSLDMANAIALDNSGNVYVTGRSWGSGTEYDYATLKYDSSGVEQWVARYNAHGNSGDRAYAIALDNSGNIYVTGQSVGSGTSVDFATVKYDFSGVEQWVERYNGPGNDWDIAYAIALDNSGNVYVTGWSEGSGTWYDYATIKYSQVGVEEEVGSNKQETRLEIYQNPSRYKVDIRWQITENIERNLIIYNATGRLIKEFHITDHSFNRVTWDGRDNSGKKVPSGIYFLKFQAGSYIETKKIILFR